MFGFSFTVCPRSLAPLNIVSFYINLVNTSWTDSLYPNNLVNVKKDF